MNNIYISICLYDHKFCPSAAQIIQNYEAYSSNDIVYHIFNDKAIDKGQLENYKKCFPQHNFLVTNVFQKDLNIINPKKTFAKYKKIVLFSTELYITPSNFTQIANQSSLSIASQDKSLFVKVLSYDDMLQKVRNKTSIYNILSDKNATINNNLINLAKFNDLDTRNNQKIFYEDGLVLFSFLEGIKSIQNSYCYFNKSNYKIYNVETDILGIVDFYEDDELHVNWFEFGYVEYVKDKINDIYVPKLISF